MRIWRCVRAHTNTTAMLAALAASAAPHVDADGFALEGTTTMLAAGRPGSVWMLRTFP